MIEAKVSASEDVTGGVDLLTNPFVLSCVAHQLKVALLKSSSLF